MDKSILEKRKKVNRWKSIVSILACVVVFCTTYALILPAITMEKETFCGDEEHTHTEICYLDGTTDTETKEDFEETVSEENVLEENAPEENVPEENVPMMMLSANSSARNLTGNWVTDIVSVASGEIGAESSKYIQWYNQTYGADTQTWNSQEVMATFVSYCLTNAGVPADVIPVGSNTNFAWVNVLDAAGVYRERSSDYFPKEGDIVLGSSWSQKEHVDQIGIITEVSGQGNWGDNSYLKVIWAKDGTVREEQSFGNFKMASNVVGFVEIPCGESACTVEGVLTAKATYAIGAVETGAKLVVEIIDGSGWDAAVKEGITEYGYEIVKNHYISVYFEKDVSGQKVKVEPTGPVDVEIEFVAPLESDSLENIWKNSLINSSSEVAASSSEYTIQTNAANGITGMQFSYENAQAIILSAMQETYTVLEKETALGTVIASCKTRDIPENTDIDMIVTVSSEEDSNARCQEALEEKYLKEGYAIPTIQYFEIVFKDADGNTVTAPDSMEIEFNFEPALSASLGNGHITEDGEWNLDAVTVTDSKVVLSDIEATAETTRECVLKKLVFNYEPAQRYALSAVALDPTYKIEKSVGSYEELVAAINSAGSANTVITITNDFAARGPITIANGKRIVIDLDGHTIQTTDTLFVVNQAMLSIEDSSMLTETVTNIGTQDPGKIAEYNQDSKTLTYYMTESNIVNKNTGETVETVDKYTVTLSGVIKGGNSPIVVVENAQNSTFNMIAGALTGSTDRAILQKGGTVNLKGGYICGNTVSSTGWDGLNSGGAVYVTGQSTLNLSSTVVAANHSADRGGAIAVESSDGAVLNITGGIITGNRCTTVEASEKHAISDYHLGGGGIFAAGNATINLKGGYITNNKVTATGYYDGGGGMYVRNGCSLNIEGTYVTGNYSHSSGGGIMTSANMVMTGGYVNGNYAKEAEGGGIAVNEPAITYIFGGYINNNVTDTEEHWGGGGLFCANGSTLVMEHAMITDNHAGGYGGGVAGCSTGRVFLFVKKGAAIYQNTADGTNLSGGESTKNEDHSYVNKEILKYGFEDYFCALNSVVDNYMLGGYPANWKGSVDGLPVEAKEGDTLIASYIMLLKSQPSSEGIAAAQKEAKIYVNGNISNTHGGGVLANGYMVVGEEGEIPVYSRIHLKAGKQLLGDGIIAPELKEDQFEFVIKDVNTDRIITKAKNDADGVIDFNQLLVFTEEGTFTYQVHENKEYGNTEDILMDTAIYQITVKVDKIRLSDLASKYIRYQYKISNIKVEKKTTGDWELVREDSNPEYKEEKPLELDFSEDILFVNHQVATTKISVLKKWAGIEPEEGTIIRAQLYRDGVKQGNPVELSKATNWYYSWGELPLYKTDANGNKKYYQYTVEEQGDTSGYHVEYETHNLTTRTKAWIPIEGGLEQGRAYMIVSGDGGHVLYLSDIKNYYTLGVNDKQSIVKSSKPVTIGGKVYTDYYLDSEVKEKSIYHADVESGTLVLKYYGGGWGLLTAPNGNLTSSYDDSNLYVGNVRIGKGSVYSTAYKIVYDGTKFTTVTRSTYHNNEAKIYAYVEGDAQTETIYTITNTKIPEEIFYKLDITKVNAEDENILLEGAEFELIPVGKTEGVTFRKVVSGRYEYCNPEEEGADKTVITAFGGKLILDGIPAGEYILRETKAPNGYLTVEDQKITLGDSSETTISLKIADEKEEEIVFVLPETGGIGTNIFVLGGGLLMAGSLIGYNLKYKRKERTDV